MHGPNGSSELERTDEAVLAEILASESHDLDKWISELRARGACPLRALANVAGSDSPMAEEAAGALGAAASEATGEELEALFADPDQTWLRRLLMAIGRSRCKVLLEITEEREPDPMAEYMMMLDWADDAELVDLANVLGCLRTDKALWSLEEMAARFAGPVGERARALLEETDDSTDRD